MDLVHILVFAGLSLAAGLILPGSWRAAWVLVASLLAIYWLQPATPIRHLDFWLSSLSLALTVLAWILVRPGSARRGARFWPSAALIAVGILGIGLTRYFGSPLTATPPPAPAQILLFVFGFLLLCALLMRAELPVAVGANLFTLLILALFVILKTPALALQASRWLRGWSGQALELAAPLDIGWLGFSYLAFRLIQVVRDHAAGRIGEVPLASLVSFAVFFPAYTAGPIDRLQRFLEDLKAESEPGNQRLEGIRRILIGIFKKFVIADSLALLALSPENAVQVQSTAWTWVTLYAFALRIYFDFSGYTDIAIGIGRLAGIRLPENFNQPYLKTNLTAFWNSWHMTLANWFRAYLFNPLTRALRSMPSSLPVPAIIFVAQLTTMVSIGLWHGITWNFLIWGAWHGLGLFVHNRWSSMARSRLTGQPLSAAWRHILSAAGIFLTFHFVTLGWVWFALPDPQIALTVMARLFGG